MKNFTSVADVADVAALVTDALRLKKDPFSHAQLGVRKTLGLVFLNPSLRTRMSTQKAARNLGMDVVVLNADKEGWQLEMADGAVMNGATVEHIKDAATIMGMYCDIIGLRSFPGLTDRDADYSEHVLGKFIQHCACPVVSLESATRHPLQSLADLVTIEEHRRPGKRAKVVLTWAPHIKALPQAVPNSFAEWMLKGDVDLTIVQPEGYELHESFTSGATLLYDQEAALEGADFVYAKNWSSYREYGARPAVSGNWLLSPEKMAFTNDAHIMHCLPVRRNVELPDLLLDGPSSLIYKQAENRIYAAQAVLKNLLETGA